MKYPTNNDNIDYFSYDNLSVSKNLTVTNNLTIKNSLIIDHVNILNNGTFKGNVSVKNYGMSVKKNINIQKNLNIINNNLKLQNNTTSKELNIDTIRNSSSISIFKNINIKNNLNTGNLDIKKDSFFNYNTLINNDIIVNNNFNIFKHNINSFNTIITNEFLINKDISLDYIIVDDTFNLKGNLTSNNLKVFNKFEVIQNTNIDNGVLTITENSNINELSQIIFSINTNTIQMKLNNNIINLNDLYAYDEKSFIKLHDNHDIDLNILNKKVFDFEKTDLNINYNTNLYNLNVLNHTNITKDVNVYNILNINDICSVKKNHLELPGLSKNAIEGSICYNNNTNKINVVYDNKWEELKFLDNYNTGIIKHNNNNLTFKITNNQYVSLDNNINIDTTTSIKNNLLISQNLNIYNNFNIDKILNINDIPIQLYRNILRTYNKNEKKWYSITRQDIDSKYYSYFKSTNFYLYDISNEYTYLNTSNYINPRKLIVNQFNNFIYQIIDDKTYFTDIFTNIINHENNIINIQIYKNDLLIHSLDINKSIINNKLSNVLVFNKNDKLMIKIKSNKSYKQSILINLLGHRISDIKFRGDSNFINDSPIFINQNGIFKTNISCFKTANIKNIISNNNTILNTSQLHIKKVSNNDSLLEIGDSFFVHNDSRISIQSKSKKNNSFITINSDLEALENMYVNQNLNIYNNSFLKNINIDNSINSKSIYLYNTNINFNSVSNFDELNLNNSFINNNLNLINDSNNLNFIIAKNLILKNYKSDIKNSLSNNSLYLSCSNNSNISLIYNYNSIVNNFINHKNIKHTNNNIVINDNIYINNNNVSFINNNSNTIFNIQSDFSIKSNGSIYIDKDLVIKNINFSKKFKSLLYDIYN